MAEQPGGVNQFSYSPEVLAELESALSAERLGTYVSAVPGHDKEQALRLYAWNVALGSAFYGMLQGLEVTLRNAMHGRLAAAYGPEWYDNPRVGLDDGGTRRIDNSWVGGDALGGMDGGADETLYSFRELRS